MKIKKVILAVLFIAVTMVLTGSSKAADTSAGWQKYAHNPVLDPKLGHCFDVSLLKEGDTYRMWFSWKAKLGIGLVESKDGIHWSEPVLVFGPDKETGWEDNINRPIVIKRSDGYHMWYSGQTEDHSWIGYATSADGKTWKRMSERPVLSADTSWEKDSLMCPDVIWDEEAKLYRMWYSGGDWYEPNAIGYATSPDGLHWTKSAENPIFGPDPNSTWEQQRVAGVQVILDDGWYYMFYIGYSEIHHAQIGLARSRDGINNWQRLPDNPIIRTSENKAAFDSWSCYKPFAIFDGNRWLLWYNGNRAGVEHIGLAIHEGHDLGF